MATDAPPAVLTIAGTDTSGGAGIQADLKTITALGCYGAAVATALTAQNTTGVQAIHACPPAFVEQQIRSVLEDIPVRAMKTGMLFNAENTLTVARTLKSFYTKDFPPIVCDPVCVSTSGHTLLQPDALEVLIEELFPITALVTPNKAEAELLLARRDLPHTIERLEDMITAAQDLLKLGPKAALVKGGHLTVSAADVARVVAAHPHIKVLQEGLLLENMEIIQATGYDPSTRVLVVDVLHDAAGTALFVSPRIESTSTHGTGCTLSAALACALSRGESLLEATRQATEYTHLGIETAFSMGKGHGPLNHMHALTRRLVPLPTERNPYPLTQILIRSAKATWQAYVEHDFVRQLGQGTLPRECFVHFIRQDYLYLRYYARAYGMMVAKASTYDAMGAAVQTIANVLSEVSTHKTFCAKWGISEEDLVSTPESPATTAYGAYIMDVALQGDSARLVMALSACLLGYGEVGLRLKKEAAKSDSWVKLEGNPYLQWIEDYSGSHYQGAVRIGIDAIEELGVNDPPNALRFKEWCAVWERCTRLEKGFWDMAMHLQ